MSRICPGRKLCAAWRHLAGLCCLLYVGLMVPAFGAASATPGVFSIMPLGDSLTAGYPFPEGTSYRKALLDRLRAAGIPVDYVGSLDVDPSNQLDDLAHEGHFGATVASIRRDAAWLQDQPEIILLMAGSNDIRNVDASMSFQPLEDVLEQFEIQDLIREIRGDYARLGRSVQIFVSTLPPQGFPADGSPPSRLMETLPRLLSGMLSTVPRPIDREAFNATFAELLLRYALTPDMERLFADADADGSGGLSDEEAQEAVRQLALYSVNRYIDFYRYSLELLASRSDDVHLVDAGSVLAPADLGDGMHPAAQQGYERMAPVWFDAISAWLAGEQRYWAGGSGSWSDPENWAATRGGTGGAGQPEGGAVFLLQDDAVDRVVHRQDGNVVPLSSLELDATGQGEMTLRIELGMPVREMLVGRAGHGRVEHQADLLDMRTLTMGLEPGSAAFYGLDDALLRVDSEIVGAAGNAAFIQRGGSNQVRGQLILASDGGRGTYTLAAGELSAGEEIIGLSGTGVFTQVSGLHSLPGPQGAQGASGTLVIGSGPRNGESPGVGTYDMINGALDAVRIVNRGTFLYRGGEILADFDNEGTLRVTRYLQLPRDFRQQESGMLILDNAFAGSPATAIELGRASIDGTIVINPAPGAPLLPGETFEVLTAVSGIDASLLDHVRLPLLPGTRIARATVEGNALRITIDTVRCEDVRMVRSAIGQTGTNLPADVNHDGVVNVRDLAAMARKLAPGTVCNP